jgi:hypothetical protein
MRVVFAAMSCGQTLMHCWLGHHRLGGRFFHNHINFHHTYYARGHLTSAVYRGTDGNNTPFFLIPTTGGWRSVFHPAVQSICRDGACRCGVVLRACDKEYHVEGSRLERFAWFKRQLHFAHHLHANSNFAVIDFFWDRILGTYRKPDQDIR